MPSNFYSNPFQVVASQSLSHDKEKLLSTSNGNQNNDKEISKQGDEDPTLLKEENTHRPILDNLFSY